MPKKVNFKLAVSVTRQVNLNPTEKIEKFKCDILSNFQTLCAEFSVGLNNNKNNFSKVEILVFVFPRHFLLVFISVISDCNTEFQSMGPSHYFVVRDQGHI